MDWKKQKKQQKAEYLKVFKKLVYQKMLQMILLKLSFHFYYKLKNKEGAEQSTVLLLIVDMKKIFFSSYIYSNCFNYHYMFHNGFTVCSEYNC